jgi:class 3 adenylate cyclase
MLSNVEQPDYARTPRGAQVAFIICGSVDGEPLVYLPGFLYSIESIFEDGPYARFIQGLARHGPVAMLERQGVGASDPIDVDVDIWEQWADDVVAVADALGADRVSVMGYGPSSHLALEAAIRHPDRVSKVVAMHPYFQVRDDELEDLRREVRGNVEREEDASRAALIRNIPSRASEQGYLEWSLRAGRLGSGPSAAMTFWDAVLEPSGLADRLAGIQCPVLFLLRRDNMRYKNPVGNLQVAISGMREGRIHEVDGADLIPNAGDVDALVFDIVEFLHGPAAASDVSRTLGVILFSDIVGSTSAAALSGDARWARLLDQHDLAIRRLLRRHAGTLVNTTGDGALMCFEEPSRAIEFAVALRDELSDHGLSIRVGLHLGEFERRGVDVSGVAVNLAARVMAEAGPDEILTSGSIPLGTLGGDAVFRSIGERSLKGFASTFELFIVERTS